MHTPPATYGPWRQAAWHSGFLVGHETAITNTQAVANGLLEHARDGYERQLAVLREENSTLRRMLEATASRADALTTELARSMVVSPPMGPPPPPVVRRAPTSPDPIRGLGNVLDPVPFGDPDGVFASAEAASLMIADEDDADRSAA